MKMPAWPITTEDKGYAVHLLSTFIRGEVILLFLALENAYGWIRQVTFSAKSAIGLCTWADFAGERHAKTLISSWFTG